MNYVTNQVYYKSPCPECGGEATWHGQNVALKVPLDVHSTQEYYEDQLILSVKCAKCDAKEMRWVA